MILILIIGGLIAAAVLGIWLGLHFWIKATAAVINKIINGD